MANPHDDNVSLDTFVDWLIAAGHPIQRIDDYQEWLARFETALKALPEKLRRLSVLPLLHAYNQPQQSISGVAVPTNAFRAAVRAAKVGPSEDIPHLTPELINKHATDLELRGFLRPRGHDVRPG